MTYRYVELALGRNRHPEWGALECVPCDEAGRELTVATEQDDILLWGKKVIDYTVEDKVMYCRLAVTCDKITAGGI